MASYQEGGSIFMDTAPKKYQSSNSTLTLNRMPSSVLSDYTMPSGGHLKGYLLVAMWLEPFCLTLILRTARLLWRELGNDSLGSLQIMMLGFWIGFGPSFVVGLFRIFNQ
jgi:hypothetical protein